MLDLVKKNKCTALSTNMQRYNLGNQYWFSKTLPIIAWAFVFSQIISTFKYED